MKFSLRLSEMGQLRCYFVTEEMACARCGLHPIESTPIKSNNKRAYCEFAIRPFLYFAAPVGTPLVSAADRGDLLIRSVLSHLKGEMSPKVTEGV